MDCTIVIKDNLWAVAKSDTPGVQALVRDALTYRPKGYVYTSAYRLGYWSGDICLVKKDGRFPAGLVAHVVEALKVSDIQASIEDRRIRPASNGGLFTEEPTLKLKGYQEQAVTAACAAGRGIVHHPVGSGKTHVLLEIVKRLGVPAIALVHRKDLLYQLAERARDIYKIKAGIVGDGRWEEGEGLTVATFQTIYTRLKGAIIAAAGREPPDRIAELKEKARETAAWLQQFQAVHVDEVHHVEAETYGYVMQHLPNAYYRFGYSATPTKSGDKGTYLTVVGWTGPVVSHLPSEKGIEAGRLVPADVFLIGPLPGRKAIDFDYQTAYETGITKHRGRNDTIILITQALRKLGPTLILVERIEHGQLLADTLGVPFASGSTPGDKRVDIWGDMRQGRLDCVVASVIADEGLDIYNIEHLILAGGGRAPHRQIQRIGRGMRTAPGKDRLMVFDFADTGFYLGRQYRSRLRTYKKEKAYTTAEVRPEEIEQWLT